MNIRDEGLLVDQIIREYMNACPQLTYRQALLALLRGATEKRPERISPESAIALKAQVEASRMVRKIFRDLGRKERHT
jgi:hypothetical protein